MQALADAAGLIGRQAGADSTACRAHQHAAGAVRHGERRHEPPGGQYGEGPDTDEVRQGVAAVASVLAAVGGYPDGPGPGVTERTAALAAALPPPSAYGQGVKLWDGAGDPDLTCSISLDRRHLPSAVPVVARTLTGRVTVREEVAVLPDEETAERTRRLLVVPEGELKSARAEAGRTSSRRPR